MKIDEFIDYWYLLLTIKIESLPMKQSKLSIANLYKTVIDATILHSIIYFIFYNIEMLLRQTN